ncbi:hypothetical protein PENTCL1PPCAC_24338, partial [Pristionchus entomophagus]
RSVFSACGHAVCSACAEQMALDASQKSRALLCLFCSRDGSFVSLIEHRASESTVNDMDMQTRNGEETSTFSDITTARNIYEAAKVTRDTANAEIAKLEDASASREAVLRVAREAKK